MTRDRANGAGKERVYATNEGANSCRVPGRKDSLGMEEEEEEEEASESQYSHRRLIEIPDLDPSSIWPTIGNVDDPGNANAGLDF